MDIKEATSQDMEILAELNKVVHDLHVRAAPHFFKPHTQAAMKQAFEDFLSGENFRIFVGYDQAEPVGYMIIRMFSRPDNAFTFERKVLYIDQIAVKAERQGQGFGAEFITSARALARDLGYRNVELDVWVFNQKALNFFAGQGFKTERALMSMEV